MQLSSVCKQSLPFALRTYQDAELKTQLEPGDQSPETDTQAWTWTPNSTIDPDQLEIYASGGSTTSRQTMQGRWDHGEYD